MKSIIERYKLATTTRNGETPDSYLTWDSEHCESSYGRRITNSPVYAMPVDTRNLRKYPEHHRAHRAFPVNGLLFSKKHASRGMHRVDRTDRGTPLSNVVQASGTR